MTYVIGIDGGGTKSLLQVMDLHQEVLFEIRGGPTNIYATSPEAVEQELAELLRRMTADSGYTLADCAALCLGSAGADRPYEKELLEAALRRCGVTGTITITHDAETILVAGSGKLEGITIVSGTGSIGFARDLSGNRARTGGWGHLIGDEGGGYSIGNQAIRAAVRSADGREPPTLLLPLLMKEIGLEQPEQFLQYVYRTAGKAEIAALAIVVSEAYLAGDRRAQDILDDAGNELYLMADTLIRKLNFTGRPVSLVASGSVLTHIPYLLDRLGNLVQSAYPAISVVKPRRHPAYGAALIALHSLK